MFKNLQEVMVAAGVAAMLTALPASALAVTIPYSENFDDGAADDFVVKSGTWSVGANATFGSQAYTHDNTSEGTARSLIVAEGVPESDFVLTMQFVINEAPAGPGSWTADTGFYLFGSGGSFETAGAYIFDVQYDNNPGNDANLGRMRIHDLGNGGDPSHQLIEADFNNSAAALALNTIYTMTVSGTYDSVDDDLFLEFTLTDGVNSTTISATDVNPGLADNVVIRHGVGGAVETANISYDNFNIAVPEPASLALLGAGASLIVVRRR